MHKNILSYWQYLECLPPNHADKPSARVCTLLQEVFEKWESKSKWVPFDGFGHLFDYYKNPAAIKALPISIRKGLAIKKTIEYICNSEKRERIGSMEIHPLELIVGTLPPYSVGQGKEVMRYLTEDEKLFYELRYLNEWSPFGHIVPDHENVIQKGLIFLMNSCQEKQRIINDKNDAQWQFYQSVIDALEGVLYYTNAYADFAYEFAEQFEKGSDKFNNLMEISERLRRCPAEPCKSFMDALQTIYIMHCVLHFTGEIVSIGRLDQILWPFYEADLASGAITEEMAQEAIDCFWIKLDEKVTLNRRFVEDRFTSSDGALLGTGGPSNFDQGALVNQWMQQITLGGVVANNDNEPLDACNLITKMCLISARRLPLNSPTLDFRVHKNTKREYLELAAKAILSGGAHPILMNDDKIIPALQHKSGGTVELKSARNYACDGCYETLFPGETEFSFGFVGSLDALEKTLNSGAGFAFSGSTNLRGAKSSYRTKPAVSISDFESFWEIMRSHILLSCHKFVHGILTSYGTKETVSPSPLLSAMINGCLEKGMDISGGGARYHIFAPLMTGISTAADSLYVIKKFVFDDKVFSLAELVACLRSNWGRTSEVVGLKLTKERIEAIRKICMEGPKFGQGSIEVDRLAWRLIQDFYDLLQIARNDKVHEANWKALSQKYSTQNYPFEILFTPGVGTFEQFNFSGSFVGATPDGRFAFDPIASDFSPSPYHTDQRPWLENGKNKIHFINGLSSYSDASVNLLSDGAPSDFNIPENYDENYLVGILCAFSEGHGSNMLTITVADPQTFIEAQKFPEEYNLVRVRMGGWTEFFISLFPMLQEQHKRRPLFH